MIRVWSHHSRWQAWLYLLCVMTILFRLLIAFHWCGATARIALSWECFLIMYRTFIRLSLGLGAHTFVPWMLIKGSKWERLGLIVYARPVMVNLLGPQGSAAPCLCNALIIARHQQHWACSLPFTHPIPQEYISILCYKRAVAGNLTAFG